MHAYSLMAAIAAITTIAPQQSDQAAAGAAPPETAAQPSPQVAEGAAMAECCAIAALTPVELEIVDPASSRTSLVGQKVRIRTAEPVVVDGKVVIPAGVEGFAEIVQASKARMMGKPGELTLGLPYLMLNGERIGLKRMRYGPSSGHNANTEVMLATALIGLPGMIISGGNIEVKSGARAHAVVASDTRLAPAR